MTRSTIVLVLVASVLPQVICAQEPYDVAINSGRVMDPETGLDAVRSLGVNAGAIAEIAERDLKGRVTIDARGMVVAPGFIDLHSHGQDAFNYDMKAADGVTTALELEVGVEDIDRWYLEREGKSRVHFGASVGHIPVRMKVMGDPPRFLPTSDARCATTEASEEEMKRIVVGIERGLRRGAVAVGFGIQYTAAASRFEILECFRAAARWGASCHVHMRHNGVKEPNNSTQAIEEVIALAAVTGAPLHVVHIHSTSMRATARHLQMIDGARLRGVDVTTECYPYTAGMTDISSGVFADGWKDSLEIDESKLVWVATGERLTPETFAKYRKTGGLVAIHSIPEEAVLDAIRHPLCMIASDGLNENRKGHPRAAGCYARLLGHYVRETKALSLMEALAKSTLQPARRLERLVPSMRRKGRVRKGADADLTLFDPEKIADRATFEEPTLPSIGIAWVLVGGKVVLREGKLVEGAVPGQGVRGETRQ